VLALDHEGPAIYNVVDDDPAPVREWLPVLAEALAQSHRRISRPVAGPIAGEAAVVMGTEARGASNAKAKRELGWTPRYPSWRKGFAVAYSALPWRRTEASSGPTDRSFARLASCKPISRRACGALPRPLHAARRHWKEERWICD
jgi:hypothetical protein